MTLQTGKGMECLRESLRMRYSLRRFRPCVEDFQWFFEDNYDFNSYPWLLKKNCSELISWENASYFHLSLSVDYTCSMRFFYVLLWVNEAHQALSASQDGCHGRQACGSNANSWQLACSWDVSSFRETKWFDLSLFARCVSHPRPRGVQQWHWPLWLRDYSAGLSMLCSKMCPKPSNAQQDWIHTTMGSTVDFQ